MTANLISWPNADLAGAWELTQPVPVDGSAYTEPTRVSTASSSYLLADGAAPATVTAAHTIPAGVAVDDTAILLVAVSDVTATAELAGADVPVIQGTNEVQTLTSVLASGDFTVTFDAQVTAAIAFDATAATIQTALEALSNVAPGDIACTGGPLNASPVTLTFGGAYEWTDVAQVTTSSGDVTPSTITAGVASRAFTLRTSPNIAQVGAANTPQVHVWTLALVVADAGRAVNLTIADHGPLYTRATALLVERNLNPGAPIASVGAETVGSGSTATFGAITASASGAKVLAVLAKARTSSYYTTAPTPSAPSGYVTSLVAVGDAITLAVWRSGALPAGATTPATTAWSEGSELWLTFTLELTPATPASAGVALHAVIDDQSTNDWIEMAGAAGSMYEVVELDLSGLPVGSVPISAAVAFSHSSTVLSKLRATLVGIDAGGVIHPATEESAGYTISSVSQPSIHHLSAVSELGDGSLVSEYTRLGIAFISSERHPQLSTHRLLWAKADVAYEPGGPVVSSVVGPALVGNPVTWVYSSASGLPQSHYQIMVVAGSAQDPTTATTPTNPAAPVAGEIIYDSGFTAGELVRSAVISDGLLGSGVRTVAVRARARLSNGATVTAAWGTANFDIAGAAPAGGVHNVQPDMNVATGGVDVELGVPAGVSRAWLLRSVDSGATYAVAEGSPFDVVASSTQTITDYYAPPGLTTVRYAVAFDTGPASDSGTVAAIGTGVDIATQLPDWMLLCPDDPGLNIIIKVRSVTVSNPARAVIAEQPGNSVSAVSQPLAARIDLDIWVKDPIQVASHNAILTSGLLLRLVDIWGNEWTCRSVAGIEDSPQRWGPRLGIDAAGLRDSHVYKISLVEEL